MNEQNAKAKRSKRETCTVKHGYFLGFEKGFSEMKVCGRRAVVRESWTLPKSEFTKKGKYSQTLCERHATKDTSSVVKTWRAESL